MLTLLVRNGKLSTEREREPETNCLFRDIGLCDRGMKNLQTANIARARYSLNIQTSKQTSTI